MERTLSIIKPDAVAANRIGAILQLVEQKGFQVVAMRMLQLDRRQAEGFYEVHRKRDFFDSLVAFMTSGSVVVSVLQGEKAISEYRDLMGPTDPAKAGPQTIRGLYGTNIERNAVHGSDGPETARTELAYFSALLELSAR